MFQQTIQDVLALAEAGPRPEDLLEVLRARIAAFEAFECGEIVARTEAGLLHFVVSPGLGDLGPGVLQALGTEPTLRLDTADELDERGLAGPGLTSLLALRLESSHATAAAIVLGHRRAWSFAAAPLSRIRTLSSLALRLLLRSSRPSAPTPAPEVLRLTTELARMRAHASSLEDEVVVLRAERAARKGSS